MARIVWMLVDEIRRRSTDLDRREAIDQMIEGLRNELYRRFGQ
jgi:hypothetical protein